MADSYWLEQAREPVHSRRLEGPVDVAIVGGGVTGCSCAFTLASAGKRVRLHEARQIASGASGRNGGFALRGGSMPYDVARETLGPGDAEALWRFSERALDRMEELAGDALRRCGSLRVAFGEDEAGALRTEYDALREDGFAVEWVDPLPAPLDRLYAAAIRHPEDGALEPVRWVRRLAQAAADAGADLRESSPVESIEALEADQVVVATDGYTKGLLPELDSAVRPTRGQVIATEPLPRRLFDCPHYARQGFDYWHQTRDNRLVAGGRRDTDLEAEWTGEEATTEGIQTELEHLVRDLLGHLPPITHRWAGIFGSTHEQRPLVGELQTSARVWAACGYTGHGNVLGLACGDLVARAILGDSSSELRLFAQP